MCRVKSRDQKLSSPIALLKVAPLAAILIACSDGSQDATPFPARSSDLGVDQYWFVIGQHVTEEGPVNSWDLNVRQKSADSWTASTGTGDENEDHFSFGMPLYAPADGKVVSCWNNHPDNEGSMVNPERCCNGDCSVACDADQCTDTAPCRITRSGNHMAIRKSNGDVVLLAHLQSGSIPPDLCPHSDEFMIDSRRQIDLDSGKKEEFPRESTVRLCQDNESPASDDCFDSRPTVKRGQRVGRAGNSGATSGSHLHIQTRHVTETPSGFFISKEEFQLFKFAYGWQQKLATDSHWRLLKGSETNLDQQDLIHASPYLRRAEEAADPIQTSDTLFLSEDRVVTATIARSNANLELIVWDLTGVTQIDRKGDIDAESVTQVRLSEPQNNFVLAAVRTSGGTLTLKAYRVTSAGNLALVDDREFGPISSLDMVTVGSANKIAVTAFRTQHGNLKLVAWDIVGSGDSATIVRLGEKGGGPVGTVSIAPMRGFNGVYTAVHDDNGKLLVSSWALSADGNMIIHQDSVSAGPIGPELDVAPLKNGVAVAVRDSEDFLRLISWNTLATGHFGSRRSTAFGGKFKLRANINLLTSTESSNLTSVVRGKDDNLYIIGWTVEDHGDDLRRIGSSRTGEVKHISADIARRSYSSSPRDMIVTSVRDSADKLKLITWDVNLVNP